MQVVIIHYSWFSDSTSAAGKAQVRVDYSISTRLKNDLPFLRVYKFGSRPRVLQSLVLLSLKGYDKSFKTN